MESQFNLIVVTDIHSQPSIERRFPRDSFSKFMIEVVPRLHPLSALRKLNVQRRAESGWSLGGGGGRLIDDCLYTHKLIYTHTNPNSYSERSKNFQLPANLPG